MKIKLVILFLLIFCNIVFAGQVKGYYRKNGTYVAPYTRSSPSSSTYKSNPSPYSSSPSIPIIPLDSVKVDGYYRRDGIYVRPHYRSAPDDDLSNNYGQPSYGQRKEYENSPVLPTYKYDYDNDGIENRRDLDDDNNGVQDNYDREQYNEDED